jgi:hypothetical protein
MAEKNIFLFYSDVDGLILQVINPRLEAAADLLDQCFWERHYLGGPHVRVRLVGADAPVEAVERDLKRDAAALLAERPSPPDTRYSATRAEALCLREHLEIFSSGSRYRVNVIEDHGYWRNAEKAPSAEALRLVEDFCQRRMDLAGKIIRSGQKRRENMLAIYLFLATLGTRSIAHGCVSYKSHWSGFESQNLGRPIVQRVKDSYSKGRGAAIRQMERVIDFATQSRADDVLESARDLFTWTTARVRALLSEGRQLTRYFESVDQVRQAKAVMPDAIAASPFLTRLYQDERFLTLWGTEPRLIIPRVRTNLLYSLVRDVNLTVLEKFMLCYCAARCAEETFGVDLCDVLDDTRGRLLISHFGAGEPDTPGLSSAAARLV